MHATSRSSSSVTPSAPRPRLAVLLGSNREGRFGPTLVAWLVARVEQHGHFQVDVVDPAAFDLPISHPADRRAAAGDFLDRLDAADALLVVTPEYNHSFPGILKIALDLVGGELTDTPTGIVSYGGMSSGLRAAEALRPVLSALRAIAVTDTVGFAGPRDRFEDGHLVRGAEATEAATDRLLDELARFARAFASGAHLADDAAAEAAA